MVPLPECCVRRVRLYARGPLVRKGDGGVALSENLGDSIHGGRQLFRLLLCQVLTKTRVESPTRLNLFALDARRRSPA